MKKLLGFLVALAMILSLAKPFTVFADGSNGYGDVPPALPVDVTSF